MNVAILGASDKPDRYSHQAQRLLTEHGHTPFPVSPTGKQILGRPGYSTLSEIPAEDRPVHTVTVYINPQRFAEIADQVLAFDPSRIIFNPGAESPEMAERFRAAGVHVVEACTLVLLRTGQFETA